MSIRILKNENKIILKTQNTTYAMEILHGKFPIHLYYGKNSPNANLTFESRHRSFSPNYAEYGRNFAPDNEMMEFPFFDYGDFRTSALRVLDTKTGSNVTDYVFRKARKFTGGYGIGLSMAKVIVEKHRGEITAGKIDDTHIAFKIILP